jgi:hypothetical protein
MGICSGRYVTRIQLGNKMKYCLRCGSEVENSLRVRCKCGLETEIHDKTVLYSSIQWQMRYHNIFDWRWFYVPLGCLLILTCEEL